MLGIIRRCIQCGSYFDKEKYEDENICKHCKKRKNEMGKKRRKNFVQKVFVTKNVVKNIAAKNDVESEAWEADIDCVENCSKAPEEIIVWMEPLVKEQIEALMKEYKNIEWLAYLIGEWIDDKKPIVKELFIPEQKVSGASVNNISCPEHNEMNIIGVIHSHHNMGHSFSQIDADWINQNHNISLVVSHTGMDGQVRWKTPCGSLIIVKSKTKLWYDVEFDKKDFIKKAKEKINKYTTHAANEEYGYGVGFYESRWNKAQQSYLNGSSVKQDCKKEESDEPDVEDINNNESKTAAEKANEEDEAWNVENEEETLKNALTAYEKEIDKTND